MLGRATPNTRALQALSFLAAIATAVVAGCFAGTARAVDNSVSAVLAPPEIALTPGGSARATLVISVGPAFVGSAVSVRAQPSETSITVKPASVSKKVQPDGSVALEFAVTRSMDDSGQDVPVTFVITSQAKPPKHTVATLTVKAVASPSLVSAKIASNVKTVDANRPGEAALVITNPREAVVHIDALEISAPANVDVTLTCPTGRKLEAKAGMTKKRTGCPLEIDPRSQAVLHVDLAPTNAVVPGPRSLLIKVDASGRNGTTQSVVATVAFAVDVFAESDVLKSIGVPVFLLLPGVVIVLTAWFLIRRASPWRRSLSSAKIDSIGSAVAATTFTAVVSLAVSLGVARVYPWFTRTFTPGYERDYLKAYGFQDFYYAIGYSFVIAVIVWLCACFLYLFTPLIRKLFIPTGNDEPDDLLRKIGLRGFFGGSALFPRVTVASASNRSALDLGNRAGNRAFVVPAIDITVAGDYPSLKDSIETEAAQDHAFRLWRTVRRAVEDRRATLSYRADDIGQPQEADRAQVNATGSRIPIAGLRTE